MYTGTRDTIGFRGYKTGILARDVGGSAHLEAQTKTAKAPVLYGSLPVANVYGGAKRASLLATE